MARLDAMIGEGLYNDIFADTDPKAFVTGIKLEESETPLLRGTVMVGTAADGNFKPISEALTAESIVYILAENVDKATAGAEASAYKSGHFVRNRLITDGEYTLAEGDFEHMRQAGILSKVMLEDRLEWL